MSMSRKGIRLPLSPARKLVNELMHHARKVPSIPLKMQFNVAHLAMARYGCADRPSWVSLFLKAYAIVARDIPELRRFYMPWPWPHLYEHPISECVVLVERDWDGENAVLAAKLREPDRQSLSSIQQRLRKMQVCEFDEISDMRQLTRIARFPGWLRRIIFWATLNLSGLKRAKRFGTYMVSTLGDHGAELVHPLAPMTYLSFGPVETNGDVTALIVFDHRVLDARTAARALSALEEALNGPIRAEVERVARRVAA
ncbi:MAG: hypothetical protein ACJ8C4_12465 [Gemmataceae bacterium]